MVMLNGMPVTFSKQVANGVDELNDPTYTTQDITIEDCLIAPITEPSNLRESQALEQSRDQVRVHLPKVNTEDISDSEFTYEGKVFKVDSASVQFMDSNTPGRWNTYFRAECING